MKTLVIVSHPELNESRSQRFLWESLPENGVTWHHLEGLYPDGNIDVASEQALLLTYDRIIFQFPLYWYSAPPLLKQWQDAVLTEGFAHSRYGSKLAGKELQLVVVTGVAEKEYQPGGKEQFTLAELLRPFQAVAQKCQLVYLPIFTISQFEYMDEAEQRRLLVRYRQALTGRSYGSFEEKEQWFRQELQDLGKKQLSEEDAAIVDFLLEQLEENREHLDDLTWTLQEMGD